MDSSLKDMLNWARHMDQGIRKLESVVERNGAGLHDREVDPSKVVEILQSTIDDAKATRMMVHKDIDQIKLMSDELKDLFLTTESEEFLKFGNDLQTMMSTMFPNAAGVLEESPQEIEATQDVDKDVDFLVPMVGAAAISPVPNQSTQDESYAEVEFTPGLVSKVPKSQLSNGDVILPSERSTRSLLRPMRKQTLVFSPVERSTDTILCDSTNSNQNTPKMVLQDCRNWSLAKVGSYAENSESTEKTIDSPEIVERPTRPVLTSKFYGRPK